MWIEFTDGSKGFCESDGEETVTQTAERITGKTVEKTYRLPYPASPIIFQRGPNPCPPFCYTPDKCKGCGTCLKNHACDD